MAIDLIKELGIDTDVLLQKAKETKQRIEELKNNDVTESELEKLQFELSVYTRYLRDKLINV